MEKENKMGKVKIVSEATNNESMKVISAIASQDGKVIIIPRFYTVANRSWEYTDGLDLGEVRELNDTADFKRPEDITRADIGERPVSISEGHPDIIACDNIKDDRRYFVVSTGEILTAEDIQILSSIYTYRTNDIFLAPIKIDNLPAIKSIQKIGDTVMIDGESIKILQPTGDFITVDPEDESKIKSLCNYEV